MNTDKNVTPAIGSTVLYRFRAESLDPASRGPVVVRPAIVINDYPDDDLVMAGRVELLVLLAFGDTREHLTSRHECGVAPESAPGALGAWFWPSRGDGEAAARPVDYPAPGAGADRGTFGHALAIIRRGGRAQRAGWNGKGMWIALHDDHSTTRRPFVYLSDVQGKIVPWSVSQLDMLSSDWSEVV